MISIRTIVVSLLPIAFAAFALPASADNKWFAIDASPTVAAESGKTVTVKVSNLADGNSTFNSVKLTANATIGTMIITGASTDSAKAGSVTGLGTGTVTITDLSPTKPSKPLMVTLTVTATANGCSAGSVNWTAQAWTGSPGTPSNFFELKNGGNRFTSITGPDCKYSLTGIPSSVTPGSTNNLTVTLENRASSSAPSINSLVLTVPASLKVPLQTPPAGVVIAGNVITVTRPVSGGSSTSFALTVEAEKSCTATAAEAWSSTVGPAAYSLNGAAPTTGISAPVPACAMTISAPSSGVAATPFNVTVNLINGPGGANVTLASTCSFSGSGTAQADGYSRAFEGTVPSTGTCSFMASADKGYGSAPPLSGFTVYAGDLGCNFSPEPVLPPVPGPGYFAKLPDGVSNVSQPGFAAGYRVRNDKSQPLDPCVLVNYTFTNNILDSSGAVPVKDGAGNTLPANAASFVWDQTPTGQPNAVYVYVLTFQPEWVDTGTGLPTKKTMFCKLDTDTAGNPLPTDCTVPLDSTGSPRYQPMKACIGTALSSVSIPVPDPACIAEESWSSVAPAACGVYIPDRACVRVINKIIDARDPPIIRGDF
jgi:hypothetical protein